MKLTAMFAACLVVVALSACGGGSNATPTNVTRPANNTVAVDNTPTNTPVEPEPERFNAADARDTAVAKSWDFLKTQYNKEPDAAKDPKGLLSGWGPKSMNVPYTAMVLQGLLGTKVWKSDEPMIKDSIDFLIRAQETTGAWSYMPNTEALKGIRAVYITAIMIQLMVELNKLDPWTKKLDTQIASARDYIRQSQVGNDAGPAPDYEKGKVGFGGWAYSKEEIGKSVGKEGKPAANMSTTTYAIDALHACGLSKDDPLWQDAIVFLKRNQNAGEVQDEGWQAMDKASGKKIKPATKDSPEYGGAIYSEEVSYATGNVENADGTVTLFSYGSMTYNLLRAYLFAGLKKDDVPVKLAWGWIQRNYTLEKVGGMRVEKEFEMGIYYYYLSMATTLHAYGADRIEEPDRGLKHDWRVDIVKELSERQKADGSWINEKHDRWQENSPVLCTAYALNALRHTR